MILKNCICILQPRYIISVVHIYNLDIDIKSCIAYISMFSYIKYIINNLNFMYWDDFLLNKSFVFEMYSSEDVKQYFRLSYQLM